MLASSVCRQTESYTVKTETNIFVLLEIQMHRLQLNMTFYAVEGGVAVQTLNHLGQHVARVGLWPPYPWQSSLLQPLRSKGKPISDSLRSCINYFSAFPKNSSQKKGTGEDWRTHPEPPACCRTCSDAPQEHDVWMSILDSYYWLKIMCSVRGDCDNYGEVQPQRMLWLTVKRWAGDLQGRTGHACAHTHVPICH